MEITNIELIFTGLTAICLGFIIYKCLPKEIVKPELIQPELIQPEVIQSAINNPVLIPPISNEDIDILLSIFKSNSQYNEAYQSLLGYRTLFNSGEIARNFLYNNPSIELLTVNQQIDELIRRYENTPEWVNIANIIQNTPPSYELLEAIVNEEIEIYAPVVEPVFIPSVEEIPEISQQIVVRVPSNSFYDFINSEFGIKCMIAGSVIVITAIIIHLIVVYYFKTTYSAIAYKSVSWIFKLFKF